MDQTSHLSKLNESIQILGEPDTHPKEAERIADTLTGSVSVLKKVWKVEMELLELNSKDLFRKVHVSRFCLMGIQQWMTRAVPYADGYGIHQKLFYVKRSSVHHKLFFQDPAL